MSERIATIEQKTRETEVYVTLSLEGSGDHQIDTGIGFLDHVWAQVAAHGLFDLEIRAAGDLHIGPHHTAEDVALTLGRAFDEALGDRSGIVRVASAYVPMDETLSRVVVDLSGRPYAVNEIEWAGPTVGRLPTTLIEHIFESFAVTARATVHACVLYGRDDHHKAEALFKAFGRALDRATQVDPRRGGAVPSTKGTL